MLRVQRAILFELSTVFALSLALLTAVLFAGQSLVLMRQTQGLELKHLLTMLPVLVPMAVSYSLPYSFLLAVASTYGRMVADREIVSLRIIGAPLRIAVVPALALGAVLSVASLGVTGWLAPWSILQTRMQDRAVLDLFLASLSSVDRSITFESGRMSFGSFEPATGAFLDFEFDRRAPGGRLLNKFIGDRAFLRRVGDDLTLESDAFVLGEDPNLNAHAPPTWGLRRVNVGFVEALGASTRFNEFLGGGRYEKRPRDMSLPSLMYTVHRRALDGSGDIRALTEMHVRLSWALAPFAFGLVAAGVALQLSPRRRRLLGFLVSFLSVLCVHLPLVFIGRVLAVRGSVPVWCGAWGPDILLAAAGIFLLRRAYAR